MKNNIQTKRFQSDFFLYLQRIEMLSIILEQNTLKKLYHPQSEKRASLIKNPDWLIIQNHYYSSYPIFRFFSQATMIINDPFSDYHIHSVLSDGSATVEEIVQYAWKLGMREIAITDHSDHLNQILETRYKIRPSWWARYALNSRKNVHNDVKVIFGIEGDVLNEKWDVCLTNQQLEGKFTILSVHWNGYLWAPETATQGLLKAIEQHHEKINLIWHPYDTNELGEYLEIEPIVELANHYDIAMEFNYGTFRKGRAIPEKLDYMLKYAKKIYVNSDAHSLSSLQPLRKECYDYLQEKGISI